MIDARELYDVFVRSFLSLVTLFLVTKMLGKKQVSQLSLFDYVIGISIGNFAAEMTINTDSNLLNGIFAMLIFGVVAYLIAIMAMKSINLRRYFMGIPTVLIEHGKILKKNMKQVKFDINDLLEECRSGGYFDLNDIEYAIMEANGKISFLPTSDATPTTRKDMKLKKEKVGICANIIVDGKVMKENLNNVHKDEAWLGQQLKVKGKKVEDIMLATIDVNKKLTLYLDSGEYINKEKLE